MLLGAKKERDISSAQLQLLEKLEKHPQSDKNLICKPEGAEGMVFKVLGINDEFGARTKNSIATTMFSLFSYSS